MNSKEFHQQTILGLIQTTVNWTFSDLTRRDLIDVNIKEHIINWTNLRTLSNEIDWLFNREIGSQRERISVENLITEIHTRAPTIYTILADTAGFDQAFSRGIKAYSRYIKRNQLVPASNTVGYIQQDFNDQFNWGILQYHWKDFQIRSQTSRYLEYWHYIWLIINRFFRANGADFNYSVDFIIVQQNCCWCLFNYKKLSLYRTVLWDCIETLYYEVNQDLLWQQLNIQLTTLVTRIEIYINRQCTYLHFNIEEDAAKLISAYYQRRLQRLQTTVMN